MNENHPPSPPPTDVASDHRLDRIETLLTEQIECAKNEDYEAVAVLGQQIALVIQENAGPPLAPSAPREGRIRDLQSRLNLILAQHRHELADKLAHLQQGKGSLRAYRDNFRRR